MYVNMHRSERKKACGNDRSGLLLNPPFNYPERGIIIAKNPNFGNIENEVELAKRFSTSQPVTK